MSTEQEAGAPPDRAATPLLEVRNIEKTFPGVRALSGVSFDVRPGEVHALLGENGAGKSTLIKIVSGVYQPDLGSILVNGTQVEFSTPDDARRAGVATIYQELLLFPELSVAENTTFSAARQMAAKSRSGSGWFSTASGVSQDCIVSYIRRPYR